MKLQMVGTGSISASERSACCLINEHILVDCGNGIVKTLQQQNVDVYSIDTLLITHNHGDHMLDVPFLILIRSFIQVKNELKIYCPRGFKKVIYDLVNLVYNDIINEWDSMVEKARVTFVEFEELNVEDNYLIKSVLVDHGETKPCYGYIVSKDGKTIGISGDSTLCEGVEKLIQESDVSVLDCSFLSTGKSHMGLDTIVKLAQKYHKNIIPTHMNTEVREEALSLDLEELCVLSDGMFIEI